MICIVFVELSRLPLAAYFYKKSHSGNKTNMPCRLCLTL